MHFQSDYPTLGTLPCPCKLVHRSPPPVDIFLIVVNPIPSYFSFAYVLPCIEGMYISLGVLILLPRCTPPSWGEPLDSASSLTISYPGKSTPSSEIWLTESSLTISCPGKCPPPSEICWERVNMDPGLDPSGRLERPVIRTCTRPF